MKPFENIMLTAASKPFDPNSKKCSAPIFRKKFFVDETKDAKLFVCALGYGYC